MCVCALRVVGIGRVDSCIAIRREVLSLVFSVKASGVVLSGGWWDLGTTKDFCSVEI